MTNVMKKIFALLLSALLTLGGMSAVADEYPSWRIVLDEMTFTVQGETVKLNPAVELLFYNELGQVFGQASILLDGEAVVSVQGEYSNNVLSVTAEGAQDVLVIDGVDMLLQQYGIDLTANEVKGLADIVSGLLPSDANATLASVDGVEVLDRHELIYTLDMGGEAFSVRIHWEMTDGVPHIPQTKNPCRYAFREAFPGDGTDIPETLGKQLAALLAEDSVAALAALFAGVAEM